MARATLPGDAGQRPRDIQRVPLLAQRFQFSHEITDDTHSNRWSNWLVRCRGRIGLQQVVSIDDFAARIPASCARRAQVAEFGQCRERIRRGSRREARSLMDRRHGRPHAGQQRLGRAEDGRRPPRRALDRLRSLARARQNQPGQGQLCAASLVHPAEPSLRSASRRAGRHVSSDDEVESGGVAVEQVGDVTQPALAHPGRSHAGLADPKSHDRALPRLGRDGHIGG